MPKVTPVPPVYESRQVDSDDKNSDWVLVNVNDPSDVRTVSNDDYRKGYKRSQAKADPVPGFAPDEDNSDQNEAAGSDGITVPEVGDTPTHSHG